MKAASAWSGHAGLGVVAALAAATFANTLTCGFVWDDRAAILTNRDLRTDETSMWDLWSHDFWGMALTSPTSHKSYRPLTVLTFRANYAVGGYNPMGYHLLNVLLHVAASVLVVAVGRRVVAPFGASHAPVLAGALFAVHPIHCDAVASVVGRADVLCTCLSLLAFCLYDTSASATCTNWPLYVASLVCVLAATLCKELGATTLGILVTLELLRAAPPATKSKRPCLSAGVVRTALLFGLGSAGITSRIALNGNQTLYAWSIFENDVSLLPWGLPRLLTTLHTHGWYLYKLFWPQHLCYDYGFRTIPIIASLFQIENVGTLLAYASLLVLVRVAFKRRQTSPLLLLMSFGLFPFVPAANLLFPVGTIVAERLMYFPSVGFCLVLGYALEQALRVATRWRSLLLGFLFLLLLIVGAARSIARNAEWSSETELFEASVLTAPWSVKVLSNLSKVLLGPDPPRAAAYLERALSVAPRYAVGQLNLGLAYIGMGKPLHAMQNLLDSIDVDPSLAAYAYLGRYASSFYLTSQHEQFPRSNTTHACKLAHQLLDYAIAQGASMPGLFFMRGLLAYYTSDFGTAVTNFRATVHANDAVRHRGYDLEELVTPCAARNMLALSLDENGDEDGALDVYMEYIDAQPPCLEIYNNAAIRLRNRGRLDEAAQLLTSGLQHYPNAVILLLNAAQVAEDRGNDVEAYSLYLKGLAIDPTNESLLAKYANLAPKLAKPLQSITVAPQPMAA
ncbi:hypothetical protein SPRG_13264 [Saprolegnia parasitica CBS 223.65]|uniref:dolichyl-phosphate-mannose--protein mannosyltransferase n=1 Tax=Saprolegnia parasitica (strain CBS 223.65) TaxID=695850 RepID=A0A067C1Y1_SAPPC|nr:hypothetical protein SPRG_13264 [Saprolegnia parasitica CBS 223.65]KDO20566.1 hypothetical protein SPRG_13264 [Saprolegnia parasitica CBS 223.65]|eukprot:XP_012208754.1 hypothetical protein SPRG_13264 [Saprolegnia parasitica CBS 223.65]